VQHWAARRVLSVALQPATARLTLAGPLGGRSPFGQHAMHRPDFGVTLMAKKPASKPVAKPVGKKKPKGKGTK
jgi:hypothetical protein